MNITVKKPKSDNNASTVSSKFGFKIGQKVKLKKHIRETYAAFRNADGTLKNPTFVIDSFHGEHGVLIRNNDGVKSIVGIADVTAVE